MSESASPVSDSARFTDRAIREFLGGRTDAPVSVLDFGCGSGELVHGLRGLGYEAHGCDVEPHWDGTSRGELFRPIALDPYRLPYEDERFDVVVSTSVLEHAQNSRTAFEEIERVLVPGGCALHLFPAKWYLPAEPHVRVPLVNFMWPRCPRWWLALWAILGVRNEYQRGLGWREVVERNERFCREGVNYLSSATYRQLSREVFGNGEFATDFLIAHGYGGYARLARKLPLPRRLTGWITRECRMTLLVQRKRAGRSAAAGGTARRERREPLAEAAGGVERAEARAGGLVRASRAAFA